MTDWGGRFVASLFKRVPSLRERDVKITQVMAFGSGARLVVVVFGNRKLLLASSKGCVALIAEGFA